MYIFVVMLAVIAPSWAVAGASCSAPDLHFGNQ